ncbi:MAG: alpha-mannosidase [Promethearchaeota archaeon]
MFSRNADILFNVLNKSGILRVLLEVAFPIYGRYNKYDPKAFRYHAIGQSHLDTAWNWTCEWTKKKIQVTFFNALKHLDEFKHFVFSASAPVHYEYFERYFPSKFREIQSRVKENRWDIVGGMYCESDGNVPDGESLVRQRLHGQKYYESRFGKISRVAWLPDSFGFPWSYPQIFLKSGSPYFFTTKITWNLEHEFPFAVFWWEGVDGSKVLAFNFQYGFRGLERVGDFARKTRLLKPGISVDAFNYSNYTRFLGNGSELEHDKNIFSDEYIVDFAHVYGTGDGGGGPLTAEILIPEVFRRAKNWQFVKAGVYFKLINKMHGSRLPTWQDELYLEVHRGCQTSMYSIKSKNKKAEFLLVKIEKLAIATSSFLGLPELLRFPHFKVKLLDDLWKKVLFNQFHDILPGSSIEEVYIHSNQDYEQVFGNAKQYIKDLEAFIHGDKNERASNEDLKKIYFFGNHWPGECVIFDDELLNSKTSFSRMKKRISMKVVKKERGIGFATEQSVKLNARVDELSFNYSIKIVDGSGGKQVTASNERYISVETPAFKCKFSLTSAAIISLRVGADQFQREYALHDVSKGLFGLNYLRLFVDEPASNDAWNIDKDYRNKEIKNFKVVEHEILEPGKSANGGDDLHLEVKFKLTFGLKGSSAILTYMIHPFLPYITCVLHLNYQEHRKLLRVEFDTSIKANHVVNSLAYGSIKRPMMPNTPMEKGRWEFPGHKFISLSDDDPTNKHGFSVMIENRHGFDVHGKTGGSFGISLKKAPLYGSPDHYMFIDPNSPAAKKNPALLDIAAIPREKRKIYKDLGTHVMKWAIYPHLGNWISAGIYPMFFNFADEPIELSVPRSVELDSKMKLIDCSLNEVRISAIKTLFGSNYGIVIRLFEYTGTKKIRKGFLHVHRSLLWDRGDNNEIMEKIRVINADLLEGTRFIGQDSKKDEIEVVMEKNNNVLENYLKIKFTIKPHEIKTIVIRQGS